MSRYQALSIICVMAVWMTSGFGCGNSGAGYAHTQTAPVPDSTQRPASAPDMCLRAVSGLPIPSTSASYSGNTLTFTATVSGQGSGSVQTVQFDYARRFQPTQSMVADVVDGRATASAAVKPGHSYNYTARSHGSAVGAGYYCSRFADVRNVAVPHPVRRLMN